MRVTLLDVARRAGVSHMTVSRVLREVRQVRPATAARVREAAEALGYRPDPYLSALVAYRRRSPVERRLVSVAFLDCDGSDYSREVRRGAMDESERLGYELQRLVFPQDQVARERLGRRLYHEGIEGLLFGPSDQALELPQWKWEGFAPVALTVLNHQPTLHAVGMNYFLGLRRAHAHLKGLGCRRIGLMLDPALEARTGHLWSGAYQVEAGSSLPPCWLEQGLGQRRAWLLLKSWLEEHGVDGVLTVHGNWHPQLERRGLRVVYLNDFNKVPGAVAISLDPALIGAEGIRVVHGLLTRRELGLPVCARLLLLEGKLKEGL